MADAVRPEKRVSERRRQQNRRAQKNYRERQKQHVQALENFVANPQPFSNHALVNNTRGQEARLDAVTATPMLSACGPARISSQISLPASSSREEPVIDTAQLGSGMVEAPSTDPFPVPQSTGLFSPVPMDFSALTPGTVPQCPPGCRIPKVQKPHFAQPDISQVLDDLLQCDADRYEKIRRQIRSEDITIQDILKAGLDALSADSSEHECQELSALSSNANGLSTAAPVLRTDKIIVLENKVEEHAHTLPEVYANNLRIKQFATLAAARANGEMLGVTFDQLSNEEAESPFFDSSISQNAATMTCGTASRNTNPHLRPTRSQIRHSHHPYIDVLPFPTFRQRLIDLLAMEPPMIDEDELCNDLAEDGLVCWGSSLGGGSRATGSGAPWDMRSWEAQPWFLKKWWFLVGGADGELFQQSKWWNEMRGDRMLYPW